MRLLTCLAFLPVLAAIACQPPPPETTAAPSAATVAQHLSSIFSGYWVSAAYLDAVARTRSPQAAWAYLPAGPAALIIGSFAAQQDSLVIGAIYGLHEGGSLTLRLPAQMPAVALPLQPDYGDPVGTYRELSYRIAAGDTVLLLSSRHRTTHQLRAQIDYRRTGNAADPHHPEVGVDRALNRLLLARHYRGTDSLGQPVQVQFRVDGTVSGLPYKKYYIPNDFTGPNSGDAVVFDVYTKRQQTLAASFGPDTLKLYSSYATVGVPPGGRDTTEYFVRGQLRYQLVRSR